MLLSMTGYGASSVSFVRKGGQKISFSVEIKSLNSRFLELTTKLPSSLSFLETDVYLLLKKKLVRGRVFFSVNLESGTSGFEAIVPSMDNAQGYIDAAKKIQRKFKVAGDLEISDLVNLPNIFESQKSSFSDSDRQAILKAMEKVVDLVSSSRKTEGLNLKKDIEKRFVSCEKLISNIEVIYEKLMKKHKNLIAKATKLAAKDDEASKVKLEDLYAMLNKIDVNEEITRFKSHLKVVKSLMSDKEFEKGKRLDFTLQELVRETNTIAAKCSSADISALSVDIKVELEKVREQTQNVL